MSIAGSGSVGTERPHAAFERSRTTRDQVYSYLKEQIQAGGVRPGERLRELTVAKQLGVSRTPVREAMVQLEAEGLLEYRSYRGFGLAEADPSDIETVYDLRGLLEAYAVRRGWERMGPEFADDLEAKLDEAERAQASGDFDRADLLNYEFHMQIVRTAGSPLVEQLVVRLEKLAAPWRMKITRGARSQWGHRETVEAIRSGDVEAAAAARMGEMEAAKRLFAASAGQTVESGVGGRGDD